MFKMKPTLFNHQKLLFFLFCLLMLSCTSNNNKSNLGTSQKDTTKKMHENTTIKNEVSNKIDSNFKFEINSYLKIDNIYSGPVYADEKNGKDVFYRIIEIPEEENLTLYVEKISIGEEGGNYQLLNRYRLPEEKLSALPHGLYKVDSLNFIDSISISGYFNKKKCELNLIKLRTR